MSVGLYDEAVYEKIRSWTKDPSLKILKPNESMRLFQVTADEKNDKPLQLPLIALSRDTNIEILNTSKRPLSFDGRMIRHEDNKGKDHLSRAMNLNAIPIAIKYQLDIYAKEFEVADEYVRNFVFQLINHPKLRITLPYHDLGYAHDCNIRLDSMIQDNSDIPQRHFSGQFTRFTLSFTIDDAYLFGIAMERVVAMEENGVKFAMVNPEQLDSTPEEQEEPEVDYEVITEPEQEDPEPESENTPEEPPDSPEIDEETSDES